VYQKQLKEQVRQEREARLRQSKGTEEITSPTLETQPEVATTSKASTATLRVRLLNGESVVENFEPTTKLADVMKTLNQKYQVTEPYNFRITFPNKIFTTAEEQNTLIELNLYPNATLVMTQSGVEGNKHQGLSQPQSPAPSIIQQTWDYVMSWLYWFSGTGTPATPAAPATPEHFETSHGSTRGKVIHVHSVAEYNQLKNTNDLVIVDISAVWCGPCKKIAPYFEDLACGNPSVVFLHVDLDQFRNTISDLSGISSVPTFLFFKNKRNVHQLKGANSQALLSALNKYK